MSAESLILKQVCHLFSQFRLADANFGRKKYHDEVSVQSSAVTFSASLCILVVDIETLALDADADVVTIIHDEGFIGQPKLRLFQSFQFWGFHDSQGGRRSAHTHNVIHYQYVLIILLS